MNTFTKTEAFLSYSCFTKTEQCERGLKGDDVHLKSRSDANFDKIVLGIIWSFSLAVLFQKIREPTMFVSLF